MPQIVRVQCGEPGCKEFARYEADNRKHASELYSRYGNGRYRCTRHSKPDEVLSEANPTLTQTMTIFEESYGKFWGVTKSVNGFVFGPGFKAFADDFPPGTRLRVTAEILPPASTDN